MPVHLDPTGFLAVTFSKDCLITSLSPAVEHLTEYPAQELIGRPLTEIMADRSVFDMPRILDRVKKMGHWGGKMINRCRGGKCFESWAVVTPLAVQDGAPSGYLLVCVPEDSASPSRGEVRMNEVGASLRRISHELNNPLAVMMGFAQLILLNPRCEGQFRIDMEKLYSELKRVIQVVEEFHGFAVELQEDSASGHTTTLREARVRDWAQTARTAG